MTKSNRLASIDNFRGFAIVTMVLANYLAGVTWIPAALKHAPDIGLTVIDLIAPFFIFAIGLTYRLSWQRRSTDQGAAKATGHFIGRYLGIIGIGAILSAGEVWIGYSSGGIDWGVLQAIGVAGLLTLIVIRFPLPVRLAAGLLLLGGYQFALDNYWLKLVLSSPHGGIAGALDWSAMLILATVLVEIFHDAARGRRWFPWVSLLVVAAGAALSLVVPVSKNRVSASYVLVSLGISALLFYLFHLFNDRLNLRLPLLAVWGMNPLLLYVLHLALLGFVALPDLPGWYALAPGWLVFLQALALLGALSAAALLLKRKNTVFSL